MSQPYLGPQTPLSHLRSTGTWIKWMLQAGQI